MLTLWLSIAVPAHACGGFFCDRGTPTPPVQAAERIVFAVHDGQVTMHVQIAYQGESDHFVWIVPTPQEPDLFLSTDLLFSRLQPQTVPTFTVTRTPSNCVTLSCGCKKSYDVEFGGVPGVEDTGAGVDVVGQSTIGPYETVTLQADSAAVLVRWLQDNGYDLPDGLDPVLAPYVASGQFFVALKLATGADTNDIAPLGLRYPGSAASIPIQLTSIAATPDMRLEVYLFGESRAVPDNYLHVRINEAAIDWFTGGANYAQVITDAAHEAGGQAFATDFAGPTSAFGPLVWEGSDDAYAASLADIDDPVDWATALQAARFAAGNSQTMAILYEFVPEPDPVVAEGVTPVEFYSCLECYATEVRAQPFDAAGANTAVGTRIVEPARAAQALFQDNPWLTRLTSSMSAADMTVDPVFVFNRAVGQSVDRAHAATMETKCSGNRRYALHLADGRKISLASAYYTGGYGYGSTSSGYVEAIGDLALPAAMVIEDLGASGTGEVLFDWTEDAAKEARGFGRDGAGCDTGGPAGPAIGMGVAVALMRRRKRR